MTTNETTIDVRAVARRGFTAIELLVVLAVVSILFAISVPAVITTMRSAAVRTASQAIIEVHQDAQRLAIMQRHPGDNAHYGVALINDPDRTPNCAIALMRGHPLDGHATHHDRIYMGVGEDGIPNTGDEEPVNLIDCSRWVTIEIQGDSLANRGRELGWFYEYRSGAPIRFDGAGMAERISIGDRERVFENAHRLTQTPGALPEEYEFTVPALAPTLDNGTPDDYQDDVPGLSVALLDGSQRMGIRIMLPGVAQVTGE